MPKLSLQLIPTSPEPPVKLMTALVGGDITAVIPGLFDYKRPGGVDFYRRPGGVDLYKRPA